MRMAYLILAHNNRAQLEMLAARLISADAQDIVIIHADARSPLWAELRENPLDCGPRVQLIPNPAPVRWGHYSQVSAANLLIQSALNLGCDVAHMISGADWPLVNRDIIAAGVKSGTCHIEARSDHMPERMQTYRLDTRWLQPMDRGPLGNQAVWELRRVSNYLDKARAMLGRNRRQPYGPWRYGSSWWSLPADALQCLAQELPTLISSGRLGGTLCSDEHAIQTIIARRFPNRIASNQRFIQFPDGASNPRLLQASDLPAIQESGAWFGRKFAMEHDAFFLDLPQK